MVSQVGIVCGAQHDIAPGSVVTFTATDGQVLWRERNGWRWGIPYITGDVVLLTHLNRPVDNGMVRCLDLATGAQRWTVLTPGQRLDHYEVATCNAGVAYVWGWRHQGDQTYLYALRLSDGQLLWQVVLVGRPIHEHYRLQDHNPILALDPHLILPLERQLHHHQTHMNTVLLALRQADGQTSWEIAEPDTDFTLPCNLPAASLAVIARARTAEQYSELRRLDGATGTQQWHYQFTGRSGWRPPTRIADQLVVSTSLAVLHDTATVGKLIACNQETGSERWQRVVDVSIPMAVASDGKDALTVSAWGADTCSVACLDADAGALRWRYSHLPSPSIPVPGGSTVYIGTASMEHQDPWLAHYCALDIHTGVLLWETTPFAKLPPRPVATVRSRMLTSMNHAPRRSQDDKFVIGVHTAQQLAAYNAQTGSIHYLVDNDDPILWYALS